MARDIYDQIFFEENYSRQMRERTRTQESANSRANGSDMPNATTVVFMEDTHDGGVTITTGDFVAYFNKQYGCDRVGNMRRSLAQAQRNCELKHAREGKVQSESHKKTSTARRSVRPRFSFVKAVFGMMLMLAIGVLVATSLMLKQGEMEVAQLQKEIATLEENAQESSTVSVKMNAPAQEKNDTEALSLDGENGVEIYPVEEENFVMSELLNAFGFLWK